MNPTILYEDKQIIVCIKPAGTPTQSAKVQVPDMVSILKKYLFQNGSEKKEPYLAVIHRLDQPVEGILVFAKTPAAAKELNLQLQKSNFEKHYVALLCGTLPSQKGTLCHYLCKDGRTNLSKVCSAQTPQAKKAVLDYHVVQVDDTKEPPVSFVEILLHTGRHHQIRVQMSHIGCPIVGDKKYNPAAPDGYLPLCLCASKLHFIHPSTKKEMSFTHTPDFLRQMP